MKREQQISDAAQMSELTANRHDLECFVAGAKWADAHVCQRWHKYPDEKPRKNDKYIVYFVDSYGYSQVATYDYSEKKGGFGGYMEADDIGITKWISIDGYVKAWTELPQPPKFD